MIEVIAAAAEDIDADDTGLSGKPRHSEAFGSIMCQMAFRHRWLICTIKQNNSVLVFCTSRHDDHSFLAFLFVVSTLNQDHG